MIFGIGTDLIEVNRVAEKIEKTEQFKHHVFSAREIEYCESKKIKKYESYAARFAAKEALFKALGTGWTSGTAFNEVEILNDEHGKPEFIFYGNTKNYINDLKFVKISLSLSHINEIAMAMVIIER